MITIALAVMLIIESIIIIRLSTIKTDSQFEIKPDQHVKLNGKTIVCKEGGTCKDCCLRDGYTCALMRCSGRKDDKFVHFEEVDK